MRSLRYGTIALAGTRAIVRGPQNGGTGTGTPLVQFGAAQADLLEIDRAQRPRIGGAAELAALVDRPAGVLLLHLGEIAVEIVADDAVHQRRGRRRRRAHRRRGRAA